MLPGYASSVALGLNDQGDAVGYAYAPLGNQAPFSPCLWPAGASAAINLNDRLIPGAGWALAVASDINAAGAIVGWGAHPGALTAHPLLLQPAS